MKKLLIAAAFSGLTALSAGQYITTDIEGSNMHLELTKHTDTNIVYYVDSDNNPNTGITCCRIKGADFAIANGEYYDFVGEDGECDWDWDYVGGDWDRGAHDLEVPLSTIAQASAIKITAQAYDSDWDRTYDFAKYGEDENEMKQVAIDSNNLTDEYPVPDGVTAGEAADAIVAAVNGYVNHDNNDKKDWQVLQITKVKGSDNDPHNYLAVDGKTYILKICNGRYAEGLLHHAEDRPLSVMMPCTITVYTKEDGSIVIAMTKADVMMQIISGFSETAQNLMQTVGVQMNEMVENALESLED